LYKELDEHMERQSSQLTQAILAYLLSATSEEYLQKLSQLDFSLDDGLPSFVPEELAKILPAAQKSLHLLRAAQPRHPILEQCKNVRIDWLWNEKSINEKYFAGTAFGARVPEEEISANATQTTGPPADLMSQFAVFDLEPGAHIGKKAPSKIDLRQLISTFPSTLPSITPTMFHLTSLIFEELLKYAQRLSSSLLVLFVSPEMGLRSQLLILRDYLLLASPIFRDKLSNALYSDSAENPWVGLAFTPAKAAVWPPVGSELSFQLRTVVVDAFDASVLGSKMEKEGKSRKQVLEEIDERLGFAIRDLTVEKERDDWTNPLCERSNLFLRNL
jgi:hypothetical protein